MRTQEDYMSFIAAAFALTLAILITFQIYLFQEPGRIQADEAADRVAAEMAGQALYAENCATCHGKNGEGVSGPALNSRELLTLTTDEALFNLTRTGIPGSPMPAWGQAFGGPFTDEHVTQLVAFMRSWEATAPEIVTEEPQPDPVRGAKIYVEACMICHGENGLGTEDAPALNDSAKLAKFENVWYRNTIAHGRPAKGMPTWGTVLSPAQINDLLALLTVWREGGTVAPDIPLATYLSNALFALQNFDTADAEFYLSAALPQADSDQTTEIQATLDLIRENRLFEANARLTTLLPPEEMGKAAYQSNCAGCHGSDGTGDTAPNLHANAYIQTKSDEELIAFMLAGRQGTAMDAFEGILPEEALANIVALLRTWQE
jgi:mono/diheme cytochrome c family protein